MPVQQTSLWAWQDAKQTLGERQATVLEVIRNFPGCDNQWIAEKLRLPINSVTPRVYELRKLGRVKNVGQKMNIFTKRPTLRWEAI